MQANVLAWFVNQNGRDQISSSWNVLLKNKVAMLPLAKTTEQKGYFFKSVVPASERLDRERLQGCIRCFEHNDRQWGH